MNSRLRTSVCDDPKDLGALTPNHFLLERASPATPFIHDAQRYTDQPAKRIQSIASIYRHDLEQKGQRILTSMK